MIGSKESAIRKKTTCHTRSFFYSGSLIFFSMEELQAAGQRAWGKRFDGEEDPKYFVVQMGGFTLMKAGRYAVQILHAKQTYFDDPKEIARQLSNKEQKSAWLQHTAWAALDFRGKEPVENEAYAVLARFALQLGDANCCAVYFPKTSVLMPNDGSAETGLREMIDAVPSL
ncbi:MAG TPA: hypothetical protein VNY74_09085 [Edaphobacter sp.]|nr:hypothetical protein [Edaphobacter sp.]